MKNILLVFLFCLTLGYAKQGVAQTKPKNVGNIMNAVIERINQYESHSNRVSLQDYGECFDVKDIATHKHIADQGYGIYVFGVFGDDVPSWIMLYDATGYKIYDGSVNTEMLRGVLQYCERQKLSDCQSMKYIKGLYEASAGMEYGYIMSP